MITPHISTEYEIDLQRELKGGWIAVLSNGQIIYQTGPKGWEHLKTYLEDNDLYVVRLGAKYMDHVEWLPADKDGYVALNGVIGIYGSEWTVQKVIIGFLQDGVVKTRHFRKPEMLLIDEDERKPCALTHRRKK